MAQEEVVVDDVAAEDTMVPVMDLDCQCFFFFLSFRFTFLSHIKEGESTSEPQRPVATMRTITSRSVSNAGTPRFS